MGSVVWILKMIFLLNLNETCNITVELKTLYCKYNCIILFSIFLIYIFSLYNQFWAFWKHINIYNPQQPKTSSEWHLKHIFGNSDPGSALRNIFSDVALTTMQHSVTQWPWPFHFCLPKASCGTFEEISLAHNWHIGSQRLDEVEVCTTLNFDLWPQIIWFTIDLIWIAVQNLRIFSQPVQFSSYISF